MGLDQYLNVNRHVSAYGDSTLAGKLEVISKEYFGGLKIDKISGEGVYWRKSNQIHDWFVENLGEEVDNCKDVYVDIDTLRKLYNTVCAVVENHDKAEELLPTSKGFFFGSPDYDEYYFDDLETTQTNLEHLFLCHEDSFEYSYLASW